LVRKKGQTIISGTVGELSRSLIGGVLWRVQAITMRGQINFVCQNLARDWLGFRVELGQEFNQGAVSRCGFLAPAIDT
jgi:hypothetical protein